MINVIVPFHDPKFLNNILENFKRQTYKDKRLIIIENGEAIGFCKKNNIDCIILSSGKHHALAKNEAIDWIKKNGGGRFATCDSDDYYGPNYLEEISLAANKADVIGKDSRFIKSEDDNLFLIQKDENYYSPCVLGSTISAIAEDASEFKEFIHDDYLFCQDMIKKGFRVYASSIYNFIQYKHKNHNHMWSVSAKNIIQNALCLGYKAIDIGRVDFDIINGIKKDFKYTYVEKAEIDIEEEPIYLRNKHRNTPLLKLLESIKNSI